MNAQIKPLIFDNQPKLKGVTWENGQTDLRTDGKCGDPMGWVNMYGVRFAKECIGKEAIVLGGGGTIVRALVRCGEVQDVEGETQYWRRGVRLILDREVEVPESGTRFTIPSIDEVVGAQRDSLVTAMMNRYFILPHRNGQSAHGNGQTHAKILPVTMSPQEEEQPRVIFSEG